ncbi:hypothetical protein DM860_017089 [Cuscuta australis]|uniref:C2H2-type domain-containing protein n=1 Tax=Cuscuta australis TaxID=267555 RepID=A0A328DQU5_9ASTE|nr:hypothetical protein DM860_017089 [Cuscuta australis]
MASATVVDTLDAPPPPPPLAAAADRILHLDSIPTVDLRLLSQSELYSLSLCSPSAFDPRRSDDVVTPKLDRSVFNESAGSRKQTYSRLRLAPASSSSALRSRTPHLRATNHDQNHPTPVTDPENFQIVALLKRLFSAEANPGDLAPIAVDYADTPVAQLANVPPPGFKRKRGRPRKDRNNIPDQEFDRVTHSNGDLPTPDAVIYENSVDKDKEIANAEGTPVDLVALASLPDPFDMELRRRTEGHEGEAELLGFLQGLNGQWGSRRKKRRIVDASELGNALPKGWKLLLSLKRKTGHVWVYCRRYISPSGRHFISFEEVSSYLLSLHGQQSIPLFNSVESTKSTIEYKAASPVTNKMSQIVDDVTDKENIASHGTSSPVSNKVLKDSMVGDLQEVPVMEIANSNVDIDSKVGLKKKQTSCHKRRKPKNGQSITDGVIIRDGKFVCQFCNKSFDERHRYNGHVGAHVKNQVKSTNEALQMKVGLQTDSTLQKSTVLEQVISESDCVDAESKRNSSCHVILDYRDGEDLKTFDELGTVDEPDNLFSIKSKECSGSEAYMSNHENIVNGCLVVAEDYNQQPRNSDICSPFPLHDKLDTIENTMIGGTSSLVETEKAPDSGSVLNCSANNVEACDFDELQRVKDNPDIENESGFCIISREDDVQMNDVTPSSIQTMTERGCEDVLDTLSVDVEDRVDNLNILFSSCADEQKFDDISIVEKTNGGCVESTNDFGCNPSWIKNIDSAKEKYGSQFPECFENHEKNGPMVNYSDNNVPMRKVDDLDINELQNVSNDELVFPFSSSHVGLNVDSSSTNLKQDRSLHFSLFGDDNENKDYKSNNVEMYGQGPSETAILPRAIGHEASDQTFTRINGLHCSGNQDLNLNFGNSHVEFGTNADIMQLQQQGYPTGRSSFQIGMEQTYGSQSSLVQNTNHRRVEHQKQGLAVGVGFQTSTFNGKFGDFGSNYNTMVFPNGCWEEERMDDIGNFSKNFMGSGRGNVVQTKGTIDGSIWRNSAGNFLNHDGRMTSNANQLVQSTNCFQTYDLMSDKSEGLFKMNGKYDRSSNVEGLRSDRSEPVEYSFMGTQSLSCGQGEPKGFSYEVDTGEGFNPSFWLGKDGSGAPNVSGRNLVSTVCIWCSSTYYQEATQSSTHGVVGSMCPTCSSRI